MLDNQQRQRHDVPDGQPYDDATNVQSHCIIGHHQHYGEACRLPNSGMPQARGRVQVRYRRILPVPARSGGRQLTRFMHE